MIMLDEMCFIREDYDDKQTDILNNIQKVYNHLGDEYSRYILDKRILFSITKDTRYMRDVVDTTLGGKRLYSILSEYKDGLYIYGAGRRGKKLYALYKELPWGGFFDKYSKEEKFDDIKVFGTDRIEDLISEIKLLVISNVDHAEEIRDDIIETGVSGNRIIILNDFDNENMVSMYFDDCLPQSAKTKGAFVDIGCFDGKDSFRFLEWAGQGKNVFAFEPSPENYKVCFDAFKDYPNIKLFDYGLSDETTAAKITIKGDMSIVEDNPSGSEINLVRLDEILSDKKIGFIKADVEGLEEKVIVGSRRVIETQHPVLAISLYHRRTDPWEIANLILNYNENYTLYLRHHTTQFGDTVLYAVDKRDM